MEESDYRLAGWLAVIQAILFPMTIILGIIEAGVAAQFFNIRRPFFGPTDLLMILFTAIAVYTLLMFRKLLNQRYNYSDLDLLIFISIWWMIVFQVSGIGLELLLAHFWPVNQTLLAIIYIIYFAGAMISIGIVDILIGIALLKAKDSFGEYIRGFAYVTLAAGICEVTVFMSPVALLLIPVSSVILALIFFRDQQTVEFV